VTELEIREAVRLRYAVSMLTIHQRRNGSVANPAEVADPGRWWETRDGVRTEIIEFQKLLLDLIRHPIG